MAQNQGDSSEGGRARLRRTSPVITFYSYKGGVGRSMAVANVAVLLAQDYGLDVILVDWDLEAPGLHRFFGYSDEDIHTGVIDYLLQYKEGLRDPNTPISEQTLDIERLLIDVRPERTEQSPAA